MERREKRLGSAREDRGGRDLRRELTADRNLSVAQAAASVRAEGLTISSDAEAIMGRWARGELSTTQMRELVRQRYAA